MSRITMVLAVFFMLGMTVGLVSCKEGPSQDSSEKGQETWRLLSMTATVEAVDLEQRRLTLKGPQGTARTFTVDERVERFNEIKVGDEVKMDYYLSFASEIREPTAEEKASPSTVLERTAKALPGTAPPAGGLRRIKAVVTVEQIDRPAERVTVRGPLGNTLTVRVADPSRLDMVHLGDTVIVTYTEGLAVAVEKVE